jgi:F-type H+-transporting ATPase subunit gamma
MSENTVQLRRKIESARNLQSVVHTMKAMAASSISQYEQSVHALADYYRTVELGLSVCLQKTDTAPQMITDTGPAEASTILAIVFGSDQGLVGRFNDVIVNHAIKSLTTLPAPSEIWAVGERVYSRLTDTGLSLLDHFTVPNSVKAITELVGQILVQSEERRSQGKMSALYLFYNRPTSGAIYVPISQRLLPLDAQWQQNLMELEWPTKNLPEVIGSNTETLEAFIREYFFVSLFRACAESLASENASRLAAMQRADKNIEDLLTNLDGTFQRLRQSNIDEELFDVIAGFEALSSEKK